MDSPLIDMRFINLHEFGGADQLYIDKMPIPEPKPDEILIRVVAAGVNRPDIVQRQGLYPAPADHSPVLGLEVAGIIKALGADVEHWRVGDEIVALTNGGGYAEFVAVPVGQCLPKPKNISMIEAAALPETLFTVWGNVFMRAQLRAGETFLVHGGASGIGSCAIQLARAFGARVFTTVSSAEKAEACQKLGAEIAIVYPEQDFVEWIKTHTQGRGVDVILDMVGGDYIARNIKTAAPDGRIVNIAFMRGSRVDVNMMPVMLKRLTLTGSTLRSQSNSAKAAIARQLLELVWPKILNAEIAPLIDSVFDFSDVKAAHQRLESGAHIGKIVLCF